MKKYILIIFISLICLVVWFDLGLGHSVKSEPSVKSSPSKPLSRKVEAIQSTARTRPDVAQANTIIEADGSINPNFINRYGLSDQDVQRLQNAKAIAVSALLELDRRYAKVELDQYKHRISCSIPVYPQDAAAIHDAFYDTVEALLGTESFVEYKTYEHNQPHYSDGYSIQYAGLMEREITIQQVGKSGAWDNQYTVSETSVLRWQTLAGQEPTTLIKATRSKTVNSADELSNFSPIIQEVAKKLISK